MHVLKLEQRQLRGEAADMALYLDYQMENEEPKFKAQNNIFTSSSEISTKTPPPRERNPMLDGDADGPVGSERYNPFEDLTDYRTKRALKKADREKHSGIVPPSCEKSAEVRAAAAAAMRAVPTSRGGDTFGSSQRRCRRPPDESQKPNVRCR